MTRIIVTADPGPDFHYDFWYNPFTNVIELIPF